MDDCQYMRHWHLVYSLPIWTLGTWLLLLMLVWCVIALKRRVEAHDDKVDELRARQDAYFGVPLEDAESIRIRDLEVRRLRGEKVDDYDCE